MGECIRQQGPRVEYGRRDPDPLAGHAWRDEGDWNDRAGCRDRGNWGRDDRDDWSIPRTSGRIFPGML